MVNYLNRRAFTRYAYEVPVTIHTGIHKGKGFLKEDSPAIRATLNNYSRGGMCLESLYFLPPGTPITITVDCPDADPVTGRRKSYHSEVKWCRKIAGGSQATYGIGTMYDTRANNYIFGFGRAEASWMMPDLRLAELRIS